MGFQQVLAAELAQRRQRNGRYSMRAFARDMGLEHATLSQLLRGRRRLTPRSVRRIGQRLRLSPVEVERFCIEQDARAILDLAATPGFRTNARWIAMRTGIAVEAVQLALQHLLHTRAIHMTAIDRWHIEPTAHVQTCCPLADHLH